MFSWRFSENFRAAFFQNTINHLTSKAHPAAGDFIQFPFRHCLLMLELRSRKRRDYIFREKRVIISVIYVC